MSAFGVELKGALFFGSWFRGIDFGRRGGVVGLLASVFSVIRTVPDVAVHIPRELDV